MSPIIAWYSDHLRVKRLTDVKSSTLSTLAYRDCIKIFSSLGDHENTTPTGERQLIGCRKRCAYGSSEH